jgi:hypothetical protein
LGGLCRTVCCVGAFVCGCLLCRCISVSLSVVSAHFCLTVCRLGPFLSHCLSSRPISLSLSVVSAHYSVCTSPFRPNSFKSTGHYRKHYYSVFVDCRPIDRNLPNIYYNKNVLKEIFTVKYNTLNIPSAVCSMQWKFMLFITKPT